ncbi:uncharacterized protein isoform X4 [Castor canadensis]|uniref:Uncharacterized protein isoform X4 n=1 Tax=Castor canadensis TaxID=51338 RepID=A0AC58MUM3_CASCN
MPAGSLENRAVKTEDTQLPKMRRKRKRAYKKWKSLNTTVCTSQPSGHACQNERRDFEEEVKGNTSQPVIQQTKTLGQSKESRNEPTSTSMNGKKNSSFFPKDKKQPPSKNKIHKRKENDDSPLATSQLEKVSPVVVYNDYEKSLSGKITLQDFPNTVEAFKPAKRKFTTEVKCGGFNVQVEIKKSIFSKTGAQFPTKKRCPTCHQHFSVRLFRKCCTSKHCFPKCNNILAEKLKPEVPSKYEEGISRIERPSLKISIVGKEIKVKYMNEKQNMLINITHSKRRGKITKYRNTSSNRTTREHIWSPSQSSIKHPENWQLENKRQRSDCSQDSPPVVLAVQKENPDTVVPLASATKKEKNKPGILFSMSDDSEGESALSQRVFRQDTPQKKHFSAAGTLLKNILSISSDTLNTTSLSKTYLSKMPFEDPKNVDKERKIDTDVQGNITPDSHTQPSTEGTDHLLSIIPGIIPIQDDSDSDFCSLSFPSTQLTGKKADIYCKDSKTPPAEVCENSNSIFFPSSQNALKCSTSFSPSHWTTRLLEPIEIHGNIFSFNHCDKFVIDHGKVHDDVAGRDINKALLHNDSYTNTQQLLERESSQSPTLRPASCSSLAAGSPRHSTGHSTMEWSQTGVPACHPEMVAPNKIKVPVMTFRTDELKLRLISQNDKADSNCSLAMKNPKESPSSLENVEGHKCQITPVVMNTCHRDFEVLTSQTQDEVCLQMDFPPDTSESNCEISVREKLFLTEKTLSSDAAQYAEQHDSQGERSFGITSFQEEPIGCQRVISTRPNCEENKSDSKENYYHHIDILLSPEKQKALKDQNLEIGSLRKLSQELALRGGRDSDGSQEEAIDQWARRRQQYKDRKRCSSAGGSSFASNITEGSITSDDGRSIDFGFRVDIEEKGFYTENFHSAAWVFRGDDGKPEDSPRCLSKKPRPTAVRERTVRLFKGTGDYPWGFRIQFSKPIVVTEVDTNSAAEEAGLQIGDVVLSVNGTEVTSVEHAEAVHLARKGPDILTLVVGSDISRCPNTPWPTCRGYLHKRTRSSFVKGWRKRWFVLKHDGCLYYYKHKKDEGKCPPLEAIKLEGAEVGIDTGLGKPFVFNCVPQSGNRFFCLCATSNQEMKRWLEAMDKAAHPINQNHVWEDVTLHNSSLPPLAIKNPECLGLLHQLDRNIDMWVQHYCILKDGCLYFYASIRSTQASAKAGSNKSSPSTVVHE